MKKDANRKDISPDQGHRLVGGNWQKLFTRENAVVLVRRWWWLLLIGIVVLGAGLMALLSSGGGGEDLYRNEPLFAVKEGPLTISVTSSGNIRSSEAKVIKNQVEGMRTILWLIEEGKHVKKGDLLMELDASSLKDQKVDEEIKVESAKANLVNAKETVEITKKQGQADIDAARVSLQLAILDLEKYTGLSVAEILGLPEKQASDKAELGKIAQELSTINWDKINLVDLAKNTNFFKQGEYALSLEQATNTITLAKADLERAQNQATGSSNLFSKGYITKNELDADVLDLERKRLDVSVAESQQQLLVEFTRKRTLAQLMSAVDQQAFALEKAKHQANANNTDAQAKLDAAQASFDREQEKLKKMNDQIAHCTIRAPVAGMVVYGTTGQDRWNRNEPLAEGVEVRERQELFRLPTANSMSADIKVHESMLKKVSEGLPVVLTTDALPGKQFRGVLKKIAIMPDSQSRWMNPDLRVYNTEVSVEGDTTGLRPGMSCRADIIVKQFADATYVPVQSVIRVNGQPTVFVPGHDGKPKPRPIKIGLDNTRMVRVVSGLTAGENVFLDPPLSKGTKENNIQSTNGPRTSPGGGKPPGRQPGGHKPGAQPRQGPTTRAPGRHPQGPDVRQARARRGAHGPGEHAGPGNGNGRLTRRLKKSTALAKPNGEEASTRPVTKPPSSSQEAASQTGS